MNTEKLDVALNKVGGTVGQIIIEKQFKDLMDDILDAFGVGAVSIQGQISSGGDTLVAKLNTELPPLFMQLGEQLALPLKNVMDLQGGKQPLELDEKLKSNISSLFDKPAKKEDMPSGLFEATKLELENLGLQSSQTSLGINTLSLDLDNAKKKSQEFGKGVTFSFKQIGDFIQSSLFKDILGGGLGGASMAAAQGKGQTAQIASAVTGAIGNVLVPGIGGVVGGFLGSMFFQPEQRTEPQQKELLFRLDNSNTFLNDINRNLVDIREDNRAYALQQSFFFSASNQSPLGNPIINFNGDMNLGTTESGAIDLALLLSSEKTSTNRYDLLK